MNDSTLDLIKDIIDTRMHMPAGRVFAYNGTQDLPQDNNLFIVLSFMDADTYANIRRYKATAGGGLEEVVTVNAAEDILISLISRSTEARTKRYAVVRALNSSYSQYIQEKYRFHISTTNPVMDRSFLEATSRLNRFDIQIRVIRTYEDKDDVDYYDKFPNTSKFEPNWLND